MPCLRSLRAIFPVAVAAALLSTASIAQQPDARQELVAYLNNIANSMLQQRADEVAHIATRQQAETRKAIVRAKILKLIGGLPERRGAVPVRQFGSVAGDGFHVEKIVYESLPGFFVTANVYVPASGAGPFPAVLLWPGHEPTAKLGQYAWGANLARDGIVALAVDPPGQGERLQHFDPELGESKIGQGTGEHGLAAFSTLLIGQHVSRYFINDGMRGIDYLSARKDVDASRIGMFGCSGGGTATAYLAALDDRIKVAASACYITSYQELLPVTGNQEAEQSIPYFLSDGLDFGDWVETAAPKSYAIVSTTNDMFPFAGARQTFEEAKRIYGLYGAEDRIQWITGPGGHGALQPIGQQILAFLAKGLKAGEPEYRQFRPERREDLLCTPTGQVSTSLGGETMESLNRKEAASLIPPRRTAGTKISLDVLRSDIRKVTGANAAAGPAPAVNIVKTEQRDGYRVETITLASEPGIELTGLLAIPERSGPKPAVILMDSQPKDTVARRGEFEPLAKSGTVVLLLQPRGTPGSNQPVQSAVLGPFNLISLRAMLVGKTILGMRVDDAIRAVDWLCSLPDVDRSSIALHGNGALGPVALHAAVLDGRIAKVEVDNSLTDYRLALEAPVHRNLPEIIAPGILRKYDLGDLIAAIAPRPVTLVNPVDAVGQPMREDAVRKELAMSSGVAIVSR